MRRQIIDGKEKLHVAAIARPVVFAITGAPDFPDPIPPDLTAAEWAAGMTFAFRSSDVVREHLERRQDFILTETSLVDVAQTLANALSSFFDRYPQKYAEFGDRDVCLLVMAQCDGNTSIYGSLAIGVQRGPQVASPPQLYRIRPSDSTRYNLYGAGNYVLEHVINGAGRRFLNEEAYTVVVSRALVSNCSAHDAATFAAAIIKVAERTTVEIPIPSGAGIGGPITTMLLPATGAPPVLLELPSRETTTRSRSERLSS